MSTKNGNSTETQKDVRDEYTRAYRFARGYYSNNYGEIPDWSTIAFYEKVSFVPAKFARDSFEDSFYKEIDHYGSLHLLLKLGRLPF